MRLNLALSDLVECLKDGAFRYAVEPADNPDGESGEQEARDDFVKSEEGVLLPDEDGDTADDDADEAVEKERLKLVLRNFLLLVEVIGGHVGQRQTDAPTETVPTHAERSYAEGFHGGIPENHGNK